MFFASTDGVFVVENFSPLCICGLIIFYYFWGTDHTWQPNTFHDIADCFDSILEMGILGKKKVYICDK